MTNTHESLWKQIAQMVEQGISLIPVHDQGDRKKTPYSGWKQFQARIATTAELNASLEQYRTTAVAMVCGAVSGNMEVIDVDVKNWQGIDALVLTTIKELYPDLAAILRVHRTPSGGLHIIYRISDNEAEGNQKLAHASQDAGCAIETRGTGGYVLMPPSLGYSQLGDRPIPTLTWAQRCSLIELCRSFNRKVTVVKERKPSKHEQDYYSENPWDHFAGSDQAPSALPWPQCKHTSHHVYYTRPGGDGIGASFDLDKRYYYFFTSSSAYTPSKGYSAGHVFAIENHNGDMRAAHAALVAQGFGKVRPDKERATAERLARANKPLPANFSEAASNLHAEVTAKLATQYPHGVFWSDGDHGIVIDREPLQTVAAALGFCLYRGELRQVQDQLLHPRTERDFIDALKAYITEEDLDLYNAIAGAFEAFCERHAKYTISRMPIIAPHQVLRDTRSAAYKFYSNGILQITANGHELLDYNAVDSLVPSEKLLRREFTDAPDLPGRYADYLDRAIGMSDHLLQVIGYLAHDYRDAAQGWIVVLTEACADARDGGGAGKSAFCELLKPITTVTVKNAVQFTYDERSFGSWRGERVFVIADAPKDFKYDWLKESATGTLTVRKMHRDAIDVPTEDAPKFLVNTNHTFASTDGGMGRRVVPLEFTNFFNAERSIDQYYNAYFPNDFTADDWTNYDNLMATAIKHFLAVAKLSRPQLSVGGTEKQLRQKHGETAYEFVTERINDWRARVRVPMSEIREALRLYCEEQGVSMAYRPTMKRICACIRDFDKSCRVNINSRIGYEQVKLIAWDDAQAQDRDDAQAQDNELPY
jgi:hypothetical protein